MDRKTLDASNYDTDKAEHPHYVRSYEEYFRPLLGQNIRLLELGIFKGGSLLLWLNYFERGLIVGLDVQAVNLEDPTGRYVSTRGNSRTRNFSIRSRSKRRRMASTSSSMIVPTSAS